MFQLGSYLYSLSKHACTNNSKRCPFVLSHARFEFPVSTLYALCLRPSISDFSFRRVMQDARQVHCTCTAECRVWQYKFDTGASLYSTVEQRSSSLYGIRHMHNHSSTCTVPGSIVYTEHNFIVGGWLKPHRNLCHTDFTCVLQA